MSSVPKSLSDGKRGMANGSLPVSRIASAVPQTASGGPAGAGGVSSLQRQSRSSLPAQPQQLPQKMFSTAAPLQGSSRLGVVSPSSLKGPQMEVPQQFASVRKAELIKTSGQGVAAASHGGSAAAQGHQTYTLIAYQPNQSG